jgi:hypothetical protein
MYCSNNCPPTEADLIARPRLPNVRSDDARIGFASQHLPYDEATSAADAAMSAAVLNFQRRSSGLLASTAEGTRDFSWPNAAIAATHRKKMILIALNCALGPPPNLAFCELQ